MTLEYVKYWFELLSYAATIVGIPLAIIVYRRDNREERKLKEKQALITSHSLYVDYLKLCFENPELEIYDITYKKSGYDAKNKKELIAFEILFAYLESAFYYYKDQSDIIKRKRWDGWVKYIQGFIAQENFLIAWQLTGSEWDKDFTEFMNRLIEEAKK